MLKLNITMRKRPSVPQELYSMLYVFTHGQTRIASMFDISRSDFVAKLRCDHMCYSVPLLLLLIFFQ
jgi:hypothetical protein